MLFCLLQADAQNGWSRWSPLAKPDTESATATRVFYRTRYETPAVAAPSVSVCLVQIRDELRRGRTSNISLRILYVITGNDGRSSGQLMEPAVTLTNGSDTVVLRHNNCLSVGNVELIGVDRH